MNADEAKASYFLGLAAEQDGRKDRRCLDLARDAGKGAGGCAVAAAGAGRAGAGRRSRPRRRCPDDTMAAAKDMTEADRGAMIRGMVDRLATRLKQNGDDVEGWLRLVRAYMVMGERDKAVSALDRCPPGRRQRRRTVAPVERGPEESRARWMSMMPKSCKRRMT